MPPTDPALLPARDPPPWDRAGALARLDGDAELLALALAAFHRHAPAAIAGAGKALATREVQLLRRHLHALARGAGLLEAAALRALALELEAGAAAGHFAAVEEDFPRLCELFAALLADSANG